MRKSTITDNQVRQPQKKKSVLKEELYASEIRYRRLFESAKDGILILDAKTGKIVDVNPFLIALLGFSKQNFIEKSIWEIGAFQDIYENREKFLELQQTKYVRYDNLPLQTSTGKKIFVEFVSNVYSEDRNKVIQCNIRDITERTNTQSEIKFQADLINNVGQAVVATDLQGKVIYWNKAAEKIYGWSSSEAMGQNIIHLTPTRQTNEQAISIMQELSAGKTWAGEFLVKRKDGSWFPAFVTDTPILNPNGNLTGVIGISSDIAERKRAERELIEARFKAEENDRLKTAFLANMSHEIRTPMNGILGFTELMSTPDLTGEEQQEFISNIEKNSTRLLNLINDIIRISEIESKQIEITISDVDVNLLVEDIFISFRLDAENKKLNISFKNGLPSNEAIIKTDREKVYAVLTNLVKNAIKFTSCGSIELGYSKNDDFFEFRVTDCGPGIAEEQKEMIFNRFRQGSETITRDYEGAGLGLSISKAYVERLGGNIWVENNASMDLNASGSTFFFTIPISRPMKGNFSIKKNIKDNLPIDFSKLNQHNQIPHHD
jgi:PAS domain S-box-containing protein